jgi:hypothetical protein
MKHPMQLPPGLEPRPAARTIEVEGPVDAISLAHLLEALHRKGQRVPIHVAIYVAHEVARGLRYLHEREHRAHGSMRTDHVLLLRSGKVKLIDQRTVPTSQDRHEDVRGVGLAAWEMLVGWPLNQGGDQRQSAPLAPSLLRAGLPVAVDDLVLRAVELDPNRRYPGPGALTRDCARFLATRPDPRRSLRLLLDQILGGAPPPSEDSAETRLMPVPWRGSQVTPPPPPPPLASVPLALAPAPRRVPRWLRRLGLRALEIAIASVLALLALLALTGERRALPSCAGSPQAGAVIVPLARP